MVTGKSREIGVSFAARVKSHLASSRRLRNAVFTATVVMTHAALAHGEAATTSDEIEHLMTFIQSSNCEFNRNGTWYPSSVAHEHILKKLNYIRDRTTIPNAEYFIQEAASRSSMGLRMVYQIRCSDSPVQECRTWLLGELNKSRSRTVKTRQ